MSFHRANKPAWLNRATISLRTSKCPHKTFRKARHRQLVFCKTHLKFRSLHMKELHWIHLWTKTIWLSQLIRQNMHRSCANGNSKSRDHSCNRIQRFRTLSQWKAAFCRRSILKNLSSSRTCSKLKPVNHCGSTAPLYAPGTRHSKSIKTWSQSTSPSCANKTRNCVICLTLPSTRATGRLSTPTPSWWANTSTKTDAFTVGINVSKRSNPSSK